MAVAVILDNFELQEEEKRYGQAVQLVKRLEETTHSADANYFRYRITESLNNFLQRA